MYGRNRHHAFRDSSSRSDSAKKPAAAIDSPKLPAARQKSFHHALINTVFRKSVQIIPGIIKIVEQGEAASFNNTMQMQAHTEHVFVFMRVINEDKTESPLSLCQVSHANFGVDREEMNAISAFLRTDLPARLFKGNRIEVDGNDDLLATVCVACPIEDSGRKAAITPKL